MSEKRESWLYIRWLMLVAPFPTSVLSAYTATQDALLSEHQPWVLGSLINQARSKHLEEVDTKATPVQPGCDSAVKPMTQHSHSYSPSPLRPHWLANEGYRSGLPKTSAWKERTWPMQRLRVPKTWDTISFPVKHCLYVLGGSWVSLSRVSAGGWVLMISFFF